MSLYRLLDAPWLYRLSQILLAHGAEAAVSGIVRDLLATIDAGSRVLDVGCGPHSYLLSAGLWPIGSDLSEPYIRQYAARGCLGVVNSADTLPFAAGSFDSVWTIGLLHHLPDEVALRTLQEMRRVCRSGGHVVVLDAVMPRRAWTRPQAYILRRLDRGRFVRAEAGLRALFDRVLPGIQHVRRETFTHTGLEMLVCCARRDAGT